MARIEKGYDGSVSDDAEVAERTSGRPPYKPTEKERDIVRNMVVLGMTQERIAELLEINDETLRKYFRRELDHGKELVSAEVVGTLVDNCRGGNVASQIFYLKTQCGWSEKNQLEITGQLGHYVDNPPSETRDTWESRQQTALSKENPERLDKANTPKTLDKVVTEKTKTSELGQAIDITPKITPSPPVDDEEG